MKRVAFYTLGCKVNQYETEAMMELFKNSGYEVVDFEDYSDVYVINTCTVTSLSDKKNRQVIRRTKKVNENSIVAAVGCFVQKDPEAAAKLEEVDILIGTNNKNKIVELVDEYLKNNEKIYAVSNLKEVNEFEELKITNTENRTRAYLKIQEGCNQYCSYCIIPYVRGKIRSRDLNNIVSEVEKLVKNGFLEVVLTGIHVASYGKDLNDEISLIDVIEKVHEVQGLKRLRLSSIEPRVVDENFAKKISQMPKVCNHFHLSLQSGSEKVLKEMNRKYTKDEYRNSINILRKYIKDVAVTTDIIVGFPGETKEEFEESLSFAKEIKFSEGHIFTYSKREGTPAAKREDQILNEEKQKRSKLMQDAVNESKIEFLSSFIGKEMEVLIEEKDNEYLIGHTSNYLKVIFSGSDDLIHNIVNVKIREVKDYILVADLI